MTTTTKRADLLARIKAHGLDLLAIFPNATERDPDTLCRKLRRIEVEANALAVRLCNGTLDQADWDKYCDATSAKLAKLLQPAPDVCAALFLNGDPRGYTLKLSDEWIKTSGARLHRDWGGYGILAPDLRDN